MLLYAPPACGVPARRRRPVTCCSAQEAPAALSRRDALSLTAVALAATATPALAVRRGGSLEERRAAYMRFLQDLDARPGVSVPDFPATASWFNSGPLNGRELRSRVLVLDFWTLCCVNCMHVLPELAALEARYASQAGFAVIGVHSPKFSSEKDDQSIRAAVLRYGVTHPVVNDSGMVTWRALGVDSWPTLAVVSPTGRLLSLFSGESHARDVEELVSAALEHYGDLGLLTSVPLPQALERDKDPRTLTSPLSFPGKLAVDAAGSRLFISDSCHHRIVTTDLTGRFLFAVGGATSALHDGSFQEAAFNRPQGVAFDAARQLLYVADTENHALRCVDLRAQRVSTLAGDGSRGRDYRGGGGGASQRLNSPWDVALLPSGDVLLAMAGTHQLWRYAASDGTLRAISGDGYERNLNGKDGANTSWAQPSGLSVSGGSVYVADSESSSIRVCDLATGGARLLAGGDALYADDLFRFGDVDGRGSQIRLQHPLAVAASVEDPRIVFIADSYNHKIKALDLASGEVRTLAGDGRPGLQDGCPGQLSEPSGLAMGPEGQLFVADSNSSAVRVLDTRTLQLRTLDVSTVPLPPRARSVDAAPSDAPPPLDADAVVVRGAAVGALQGLLKVALALPSGFHLTEGAGSDFLVAVYPPLAAQATPRAGPLSLDTTVGFSRAPGAPPALLCLTCRVFYCQTAAVCLFQTVVFDLPLSGVSAGGATQASQPLAQVLLTAAVTPPRLAAGRIPEL